MNKKIVLLATLSFILAACRVEAPQPENNSDAVVNSAKDRANNTAADTVSQSQEPADTVKCPSQDFELFLKSFIDSVEVQKSFTATPLESVTIDALAEPEPAEVKKMLGASELNFPLIPSPDQQANDGLVSRISSSGKKNAEVILHKPDADYQMSFFFRQESCWKLYRVKDYSL